MSANPSEIGDIVMNPDKQLYRMVASNTPGVFNLFAIRYKTGSKTEIELIEAVDITKPTRVDTTGAELHIRSESSATSFDDTKFKTEQRIFQSGTVSVDSTGIINGTELSTGKICMHLNNVFDISTDPTTGDVVFGVVDLESIK
jgi:hypothetical protein